jgi:hypothetical protein
MAGLLAPDLGDHRRLSTNSFSVTAKLFLR